MPLILFDALNNLKILFQYFVLLILYLLFGVNFLFVIYYYKINFIYFK